LAVGVDQPPPTHPVGAQEAPVSIDCMPPVPEAAGLPQGGKNPVGVVGDGRKIASQRAVRDFGIFKVGHFPIWGLMASHTEEHILQFATTAATETYIDLSSALTATNRRQYHQFTRKGIPLCYEVTIEEIVTNGDDVSSIYVAPNNWTVRNACVKTSAAWKKQLRDAGIKLKDLSKYGRRLRIPFDESMSASGTGSLQNHFPPMGFNVKDVGQESILEQYTTASGSNVTYGSAAEFTRFTIPDEAGGDSVEMNVALLGYSDAVAGNNYFGVLDEYLGSRGGVIDEPASAQQTPDADNLLQRMFSSAQPSTDEIIEAVEDFQEFRPYADGENDASAAPPTASNLCQLATFAGVVQGYRSRADGTVGAPNLCTMKCPLGLIAIRGNANKSLFKVTVHAIYEM